MKFTLSWLKDHLETNASVADLSQALTALGLEVESVTDRSAALAPFVVGHIVTAEKHPNADKLRLCQVDAGTGLVQVVCGAPNARAGLKSVFARPGTIIPESGQALKPGVIRGVESNGMLCSARELGLGQDHDGIMELPADAVPGSAFAPLMGLDDPVFDLAITPDRADCLGVRGIARDLAAQGIGKLKPLNRATPVAGSFDSPLAWRRELPGAEAACLYVAGRYFRGLKNGPSPDWLKARLTAIGLRPISALVDITNYITYDLNRPLHVFDAGKITGDLTVRLARDGEEILALDGKTYRLSAGMIVIADAQSVQGIGGVMGGAHSGVNAETTDMFLEVALFDPVQVGQAGRALGLESDARHRFERGLDPQSAVWGLDVATNLILEICGGTVSHPVSAGTVPDTARPLSLRPERVKSLGGADIPADRQRQILEDLGFLPRAEASRVAVTVPSWRADIDGEADLVEEIIRVHGYDHIPAQSLPPISAVPMAALTATQRRQRAAKRLLAARGMMEAVTFSFMPSAMAKRFGGGDAALVLANPISADLDAMRPSILPNLMQAAARNTARGFGDLALFEVGPVFHGTQNTDQIAMAAGIRTGMARPRHWHEPARMVDPFDVKADLFAVLSDQGMTIDNLQISPDAPAWYHPGQSGTIRLGPTILGWFGTLHPAMGKLADIKGPIAGFELFLDRIPLPRRKGVTRPALTLSPFQPVTRDFAFILDCDIPAEKLLRAVRGADKTLIAGVDLFDIYEGKGVAEGKKSVALSVTLQPMGQTLTDQMLEELSARIVGAALKTTGAQLRQ